MEEKVSPVDELLPAPKLFVLGLQHVLAMYAGAVAVPIIIATAISLSGEELIYLINADLFVAGIATLMQSLGFWKIGAKVPMVEGVTFAAVTPMVLIGQAHGITTVFGATIAAGLFVLLLAPYFSRLVRFFPPVVTGVVITIIGVSLLPVAIRWAAGGVANAPDFGSIQNIGLSVVVLTMVILMYNYCKGLWSNISVLLGLVAGTVIAYFLGMTDFSKVATANWIGITTPFAFGLPRFELTSVLSMWLVMLVVMTEATGNLIAIGEVVGKPITQENLARGLRSDGIASVLGGIFNTFPHIAFAQNVGLVSLTGVKSRFVVATSGVILLCLALFPKAAAIVSAIPYPVLGGAGIAMFGMVAAGGIKTLSKVQFNGTKNSMIVAVSFGLGLIPIAVPTFYDHFPEWAQMMLHSGITTGSLAAIGLNALFNGGGVPAEDDNGECADTVEAH